MKTGVYKQLDEASIKYYKEVDEQMLRNYILELLRSNRPYMYRIKNELGV